MANKLDIPLTPAVSESGGACEALTDPTVRRRDISSTRLPTFEEIQNQPIRHDSGKEVYDSVVEHILELGRKFAPKMPSVIQEGFIEDELAPQTDQPVKEAIPIRDVRPTPCEMDIPADKYNQARVQWKYRPGMRVFVLLCNPSPIANSYLAVTDNDKIVVPSATLEENDTPLNCAQRLLTQLVGYVPCASDCAYVPALDGYAVNFTQRYPVNPEEENPIKWVDIATFEKVAKEVGLRPDNDNLDTQDFYTSINREALSQACTLLRDPNFIVASLLNSLLTQNSVSTSSIITEDDLQQRAHAAVCNYLGREPISDGELQDACVELLREQARRA